MGKKNIIDGVLVIGGLSIPAKVKVSVDLDLTDAGGILTSAFEAAPTEPVDEETVAPEEGDTFNFGEAVAEGLADGPGNTETQVSRVEKVRAAIQRLRSIGQFDAPRSVVDQFPAGYTFPQADAARTRILGLVEANLSERTINTYLNNQDGFLRQVNANYGGDHAVATYIHATLAEAARS